MRRNSKVLLFSVSILLFVLLLVLCIYVQNGLRHIWVIDDSDSKPLEKVEGSQRISKGENEISENISFQIEESREMSDASKPMESTNESSLQMESESQQVVTDQNDGEQLVESSDVIVESEIIVDDLIESESSVIEDSKIQEEESLPIIDGEQKENELPLVPIG